MNSETLADLDRWIHRPRPHPQAHVRLFCFPHLGGGALAYHRWPERLPPEIEVCAIRLPGRESRYREAPFTNLSPLVQELPRVLRPLLAGKPFALFGHSMGALIGFELARQLRRQGLAAPVHLLVSALPPPHLLRSNAWGEDWRLLSDDQFVRKLQEYGGLPAEIVRHAELLRLFVPTFRADQSVYRTYVYTEEHPLDCPITAFCGASDPIAARDSMPAWHRHTNGAFRIRTLPGGHFYLQQSQQELLQLISQELMRDLKALK